MADDPNDTALIPAPESGLMVPGLATDHPAAKRLMKRLRRKTPARVIRYRPGPMRGGERMQFAYVPWAWVAQTLNDCFGPTWGREILHVDRVPLPDLPVRHYKCRRTATGCTENHKPRKRTEVVVRVRITTPWANYDATGSHIWYPDNAEQGLGDAEQSAISKGLRRAAALMGVGLDLYTDLPEEHEVQRDFALQDAQSAWKAALAESGLIEKGAVPLLSRKLTGDPKTLPTMDDVLAATGEQGAEAYHALIKALEK